MKLHIKLPVVLFFSSLSIDHFTYKIFFTMCKFTKEILSTVIVRNLDTGQTMPLSTAAEQVGSTK